MLSDFKRRGGCAEKGKHGEGGDASDDHFFAAQAIGERRDRETADKEPDKPAHECRGEAMRGKPPLANDGGRHIPDVLGIETFDQRARSAQADHQDSEVR